MLTLCNLMDCSSPASSVHGILQIRILEWVAMPSSRGNLPDPGIEPVSLTSPALAGGFFNISATWECLIMHCLSNPVCQPPLPAYWPSEVPEQFGYFVWEKYEEDF